MTWLFRGARSHRPPGLDIGSYAVKLVQFDRSTGRRSTERGGREGLSLRRLGMAPLPPGAMEGGEIRDHEAVMEAIEGLWEREKVGTKRVVASLSGPGAVAVPLRLPPVGEGELSASLPALAEQYLPPAGGRAGAGEPDAEEARISYTVLGEGTSLDLLLVAAPRARARELADLLRQMRLEPLALDLNFLALARAYELSASEPSEGPVALVDVGAQFTLLHVLRPGGGGGGVVEDVTEEGASSPESSRTLFTRTIPWGGGRLTALVAGALGVSAEEAEATKLGQEGSRRAPSGSVDRLREVLRGGLREFASELGRSFQFLWEFSPEFQVERVVLSGGGSLLPGLARYVEESLGVRAELLDPFKRVAAEEKHFDPEYVREVAPVMGVAAGLAARGLAARGAR